MLNILGSAKRACDGLTRRQFIEAGSLSALGITLPMLLRRARANDAAAGDASANMSLSARGTFGRAKSVVVLYLYGAPSQMDTFDPKPDALVETRGLFSTISTSIPGLPICEHLPRISSEMHRLTLIRSMTHPYNNHAVAYTLSGIPLSEPAIEANAIEPRHWPYFGSTLDYLWSRDPATRGDPGVPKSMYLPWALNSRTNNKMHGGLHAAWLGPQFNPVIPQFVGDATRAEGSPSADGDRAIRTNFDPHDGITPASTFRLAGADLPGEITLDRLHRRRTLLAQFDRAARRLEGARHFDRYQQAAFDLVTSPHIPAALDVTREPAAIRERYGYTLFGQGALTARRLIEAGVRLVTVFWDEYGPVNTSWDTHSNNFPRLKEGLCPTLDQVLPAFLDDMQSRGLLDETLVLIISEHGRTPQISNKPGGGREHWSYAYCGLLAGAGIRQGEVIGTTDKQGGYATSRPTNPKEILATVYHLLGIDPHTSTTPDQLGRPMHLLPFGDVVWEALV